MFTRIEAVFPIQLPYNHLVECQLDLDKEGNVELNFYDYAFGERLARHLMHDEMKGFSLGILLKEAVPAVDV